MPYIGNSPANVGNYQVVDDISSTFNGTLTSFALTAATLAINPAKSGQLLVSINGVLQEPDDTGTEGFKVSGSNIVFSSAPATGSTFWAVWQGQAVDIGTPSDGTVGTAQMSSAELALTGDVSLGDNVKAKFGASDDLEIYHDGSNSYIKDAGTGGLVIQARDAVTIEDGTSGDNYIYMQRDNKVELFYAGSSKLATTSTGIDVTGSVAADGLVLAASSADYLSSITNSNGTDAGNGLYVNTRWNTAANSVAKFVSNSGSNTVANFAGNGDISFYEDTGTTPKLFWDASAESLTVTGGIISNGQVPALTAASTFSDYIVGGNKARFAVVGDATGTAGEIVFSQYSSNGSVGRDAVAIDSSGNVKIGDSSTDVTSKLTVSGNASKDVATFMYDGSAGTYLDIDCNAAGGVVELRADARTGVYPPLTFKTGGVERMRIDSAGIVTMPNQPVFSTKGTNYTQGTGTTKIIQDAIVIDRGNNFSSGTFTAPVAGSYSFSHWGLVYPHTESSIRNMHYRKNGSDIGQLIQGGGDSTTHRTVAGSIIVELAVGDYVDLWLNTSSGKAYVSQWNMSGHLIG